MQKDPTEQRQFYQACATGDEGTKRGCHDRHFATTTLPLLRKHVDYLVNELDELSENTWRKDLERNPRLPLLMRHNEFVKNTFELVQENLDGMDC